MSFISEPDCHECLAIVRAAPADASKIDRINFNDHPDGSVQGNPQELVKEWGTKLDMKFDERGRIVRFISNSKY